MKQRISANKTNEQLNKQNSTRQYYKYSTVSTPGFQNSNRTPQFDYQPSKENQRYLLTDIHNQNSMINQSFSEDHKLTAYGGGMNDGQFVINKLRKSSTNQTHQLNRQLQFTNNDLSASQSYIHTVETSPRIPKESSEKFEMQQNLIRVLKEKTDLEEKLHTYETQLRNQEVVIKDQAMRVKEAEAKISKMGKQLLVKKQTLLQIQSDNEGSNKDEIINSLKQKLASVEASLSSKNNHIEQLEIELEEMREKKNEKTQQFQLQIIPTELLYQQPTKEVEVQTNEVNIIDEQEETNLNLTINSTTKNVVLLTEVQKLETSYQAMIDDLQFKQQVKEMQYKELHEHTNRQQQHYERLVTLQKDIKYELFKDNLVFTGITVLILVFAVRFIMKSGFSFGDLFLWI